jgi:hypothetical protein
MLDISQVRRILKRMIAKRLGSVFLIAIVATAQDSSPSNSADSGIPKLPLIEYDACPGAATRTLAPSRKIEKDDNLYSSWRGERTVVGTLKAGDKVTLLAAVNVTREPDRALAIQTHDDDPLFEPGDPALRYGLNSDGYWNLWAKGAWHKISAEEVVEKGSVCGFGDKSQCSVQIVKNGRKEWWIEVKTDTGQDGWVLVGKTTPDRIWQSRTFGELCMLD